MHESLKLKNKSVINKQVTPQIFSELLLDPNGFYHCVVAFNVYMVQQFCREISAIHLLETLE